LEGTDGTIWRREEIEMLIAAGMSRRTAGISECPPFLAQSPLSLCGGWARALRQGQSLRAATSLPRQRGFASAAAPAVQRSITMIKKLTPDGEQCRKCNDIEARLERDGLLDQVDTHIYMDLDDPNDPGTKLATKHDVKVAPFFVVQNLDEKCEVIDEEVYTVYLKMKKQVFDVAASKDEEAADVALSIF
jgi:hypothetical protein